MVVIATGVNFCCFGLTHIFDQWYCYRPLYIFFILMERAKALDTLLVLALVPLLIGFWYKIEWLPLVTIVFLLVALLSHKGTVLIAKTWLSFGHYLGILMNYIILFLVFYLVLTPLAILQRLLSKNPIKKENGYKESFFVLQQRCIEEKDIERPW